MDLASRQMTFPPGRTSDIAGKGVDAAPVGKSPPEASDGGWREGPNPARMVSNQLIGGQAFPRSVIDKGRGESDDLMCWTGADGSGPCTAEGTPVRDGTQSRSVQGRSNRSWGGSLYHSPANRFRHNASPISCGRRRRPAASSACWAAVPHYRTSDRGRDAAMRVRTWLAIASVPLASLLPRTTST